VALTKFRYIVSGGVKPTEVSVAGDSTVNFTLSHFLATVEGGNTEPEGMR